MNSLYSCDYLNKLLFDEYKDQIDQKINEDDHKLNKIAKKE